MTVGLSERLGVAVFGGGACRSRRKSAPMSEPRTIPVERRGARTGRTEDGSRSPRPPGRSRVASFRNVRRGPLQRRRQMARRQLVVWSGGGGSTIPFARTQQDRTSRMRVVGNVGKLKDGTS